MKTQCPNCKARFNVDDKFAGKQAKCPKCTRPFIIEAFIERPAAVLAAEHPSTISGQAAEAAEKNDKSAVLKNQAPPVMSTTPVKPPEKIPEPATPAAVLISRDTGAESKPGAKKTLSKALFVYVWAGLRIVAGVLGAAGLTLAIRKPPGPVRDAAHLSWGLTPNIKLGAFASADVFLVLSVAIELILFYKMWAAIKDGQASIAPGKAVGFLFIPVFNMYWALCMVIGFAEDYNSYIQRRSLKIKTLPMTLYMIYAFALMLSIMFITAPMLCVFGFVGLISRAFAGYAEVSWGLLIFISAAGIAHFLTYILFAFKTCNAINALSER